MADDAPRYPNVKREAPEFPNIARERDLDRQAHIRRMLEEGFTREQAEKHADEHMRERSDARE